MSGLKKKVVDFEAKAEEAKQKRVEACIAEVNTVLEKHRCDVKCVVKIGEQVVLVSALINLPSQVVIESK